MINDDDDVLDLCGSGIERTRPKKNRLTTTEPLSNKFEIGPHLKRKTTTDAQKFMIHEKIEEDCESDVETSLYRRSVE